MSTRLASPMLAALVLVIGLTHATPSADADPCRTPGCGGGNYRIDPCYVKPLRRAELYNWNRRYAHVQYGQPVALVVPPTANLQTNWGWGVSSFRLSRLDHQFGRNYPGAATFGAPYKWTPAWPWDTNQFGVYHVRGPW